jgi:predicted GNAT family N-acyltransferase/ligand-binding SRPBCC domain-containing protein
MSLEILPATDAAALEQAYAVRRRVFVDEQGVAEALERDSHDASCRHVLALLDGEPIGAARYRETAVLAKHRGRGVAARIVEHVMAGLPQAAIAYVHAQDSAVGFWARMGFAVEGAAFVEAAIVHRTMALRHEPGSFAITSVVGASPEQVWHHATTVEGITFELGPWLKMTVPRAVDIDALPAQFEQGGLPLPRSLGRSWVLLLGVFPFDWDDLVIAELEPGRRFLERSRMFSMRTWQHERSVEPAAGRTAVTDRLRWEPRSLIPPATAERTVRAIFRHRHRRLAARFGREG